MISPRTLNIYPGFRCHSWQGGNLIFFEIFNNVAFKYGHNVLCQTITLKFHSIDWCDSNQQDC